MYSAKGLGSLKWLDLVESLSFLAPVLYYRLSHLRNRDITNIVVYLCVMMAR